MDAEQITQIVIAALITGCIAFGLAAQAWATQRRGGGRPSAHLDALERRLDRMEQAIDTVALEIERLGEANRFTAKLLAERLEPLPAPRTPPRVVTPH